MKSADRYTVRLRSGRTSGKLLRRKPGKAAFHEWLPLGSLWRREVVKPPRVLVCSESCVCSGVASLPQPAVPSGPRLWLAAGSSRDRLGWEQFTGPEGHGAFAGAPWVLRVPRVGTGANRLLFVGRVVMVTVPVGRLGPVSVRLSFRRTFSRVSQTQPHAENLVTRLFSFAVATIYPLLSPLK